MDVPPEMSTQGGRAIRWGCAIGGRRTIFHYLIVTRGLIRFRRRVVYADSSSSSLVHSTLSTDASRIHRRRRLWRLGLRPYVESACADGTRRGRETGERAENRSLLCRFFRSHRQEQTDRSDSCSRDRAHGLLQSEIDVVPNPNHIGQQRRG